MFLNFLNFDLKIKKQKILYDIFHYEILKWILIIGNSDLEIEEKDILCLCVSAASA